jgi:hypothetical protein
MGSNSELERNIVFSVRKRLVMGAIVAVAISAAAYVLSVPVRGTVEYHKKEYAAWERGKMNWLADRLPWFVQRMYLQMREKQLRFHGEALRQSGHTNDLTELCD